MEGDNQPYAHVGATIFGPLPFSLSWYKPADRLSLGLSLSSSVYATPGKKFDRITMDARSYGGTALLNED